MALTNPFSTWKLTALLPDLTRLAEKLATEMSGKRLMREGQGEGRRDEKWKRKGANRGQKKR